MPEQDKGWAGVWELPVMDEVQLLKLRDIVGQVQLGTNGKPLITCKVNLRTGVVTYP